MSHADPSGNADDAIDLLVDGIVLRARPGQTIAAALIAAGEHVFRRTRGCGDARSLYCAMGVCYECIVQVDGVNERACMREVQPGMRVERLQRFDAPSKP